MARALLVTGVAGGVGRVVAPHLISAGFKVRGFDRKAPPYEMDDLFLGDLTSPSDVREAARGCDALVHMAAIPSNIPPHGDIIRINLLGLSNVLEAASLEKMTHIVSFSSICATGLVTDPPMPPPALPYSESMIADPADTYGMTKKIGEIMCRGFHMQHPDASVRCLRPGLVVHSDSKKASSMAFPNGASYVGDVADAVVKSLQTPPGFGVYHILTRGLYSKDGDSRSRKDIVDELKAHGTAPSIANESFLSGRMGVYDLEAAERDLGWQPTW